MERGSRRITMTVLCAGMAQAQAGGLPATQLPTVLVVEDTAATPMIAADSASAGVVTSEQIENRPISRPAEILEVVPGLIATQHSGDGKANQYFLRGFNLDHGTDLSTSVDDVPINLRTHGHGQGYTDLNGIIPELIDTIEYRKGPYYAEDGDFASAGAVRLRYKDRLAQDFYSISGGEHGYTRGLLAASGEARADGSWLAAADTSVYDGPWEQAQNARKTVLLTRFRRGDESRGLNLNLSAHVGRWDASDQIPQRAFARGLVGRYGQIDPDLGGETTRYTASARYFTPLGAGRFMATAYAVHYDFQLFSNFTYFLADPVQGDEFEQRDRRNYYGGSARYLWRGRTGAIEHELVAGLEARQDDIGSVGLYRTAARERTATVRDDAVNERSAALFVSDSIRLAPWLRAVAGLRYDDYRARIDSSIAANSGLASDRRISPKLSLVFGPWRTTELFVNGGRGFHSNDARGSTLHVDPNDPSQPAAAQRLLVPTTGYEVGLRTAPLAPLSLSMAIWKLDIGSELVFAGDGGTTEPSFPSRRHGVEISAYFQPRPWLLIDADYARSYARFRSTDPGATHVPNAVERVASLGVAWNGEGRWSGGLRWRYLGAAALTEDNSARSRPTTIVNAQATLRINPQLSLSLAALNLLDRRDNDITYFYESRLAGESEAIGDFHFHPVEPRQFRLTLRGTF